MNASQKFVAIPINKGLCPEQMMREMNMLKKYSGGRHGSTLSLTGYERGDSYESWL